MGHVELPDDSFGDRWMYPGLTGEGLDSKMATLTQIQTWIMDEDNNLDYNVNQWIKTAGIKTSISVAAWTTSIILIAPITLIAIATIPTKKSEPVLIEAAV